VAGVFEIRRQLFGADNVILLDTFMLPSFGTSASFVAVEFVSQM
jgi:hypothetical protein